MDTLQNCDSYLIFPTKYGRTPTYDTVCSMNIYAEYQLKTAIFWDVTLCGSSKNRRFGGTYRLNHHGDKKR
jgi:hypothetical protein